MIQNKLLQVMTFFLCGIMYSQNSITGTVSDDSGPLLGVSVQVKGSSKGTTTDFDGKYTIIASPDDILVFSYMGMKSSEVTVGNRTTLHVELEADASQLSEVIVVGYGSQSEEELTGSVATIKSEALEMLPSSSFQNAMQGASPGLQVVTSDGAPGAAISVRVRGIGSINASNDPLYVIDGIPVTSGSVSQTDFGNDGSSSNVLASINPNDIESLVVLKDAASTAIYGSRGANGVVLITTKSGKAGKAKISLKSKLGFSSEAYNNLLKPLNTTQYRQLFMEGYANAGTLTTDEAAAQFATLFPVNPDTGDYYDVNWYDEITRTGITQEYDLSANGGSENITYFVSGNYFNQDGIVEENMFRRYSLRANIDVKLTERLQLTNNMSLSKFHQRGITDGTRWQAPFYLALLLPPTIPVYDENGDFYGEHTDIMAGNNPMGHLREDRRELDQSRILDNLTISYKILDNLTFKSAWSFDILNISEYIFSNARYGDGRNVGGIAEEARTIEYNWLGTQSLNYHATFNEVHSLNVFAAYEAQAVETSIVSAEGEGFSHPELKYLDNAANPTSVGSSRIEYSFNSYFGRINYDYDKKYFLSGFIRRDGSSRFGPDRRWGTFWSVGGGYTISKENFMSDAKFVNNLKLRTSYGTSGNAGIGNYNWAGLWGFNRAYDGQAAAAPSQVANALLTWESQNTFNAGIDFTLFDYVLSGSVEYFNKVSSDLLLDRPLSLTTGFESVTENIGDMKNSGWEIALHANIVNTENFGLSLGGNITFLNNEITYLPSPITDGTKRLEEGRDIQEYFLYGWAGVDPANGDPLWYTDGTKTTTTNNVNDAIRYYDGKSATPDFYGGFNLSAHYKNISLNAMFNYQFGNYLYDAPGWVIHSDGRYNPRSTSAYAFENRWTTPGQEALFPQFRWGGNQSSNTQYSDRYLFEGDYIRLKSLTLNYDFTSGILEKMQLSSLRVYVDMANFWTWVKDKSLYFDPEQTINGVYNTITPINKTVSVGLNIGF
ncbi:SusC/RagA family TonB-linked outer membrane protein [Sinomicrobium oceani]|uniref:SusC/RagA family TonB-linked outer membrane protein n=1 Tax=Sinomicrobium oceani TaxID=1150368 RepID=UPI00227A2210|nr:TonB-dependent receptor [Sinomicrobium oceani]